MSEHHQHKLPHPQGRGHGHTHGVMQGWIVAPYDLVIARIVMRPVYRRLARAVAAELPTGASVADIGTGPGRFPIALRRLRPDLDVSGVDPSADMLARARHSSQDPSITWIEAPAESLPLADGTQDLVISSLSSHHWADADLALAEQARVLKPGGALWVVDLNRHLDPSLSDAIERAGLRLESRPVELGLFGRRFTVLRAVAAST